jgi:hypothetical protein
VDEAVGEKDGASAKVAVAAARGSGWAVVTTVAEARRVLSDAYAQGASAVVVAGRCARCGRLGQVVHFDGVLRARPGGPDP